MNRVISYCGICVKPHCAGLLSKNQQPTQMQAQHTGRENVLF